MINARWIGYIEETSQMIGAIWMNNATERKESHIEMTDVIGVYTNSSGKVFQYDGNLELHNGAGEINLNTDKSHINKIEILSINNESDYVAVTSIGLLFCRLNEDKGTLANLYLYLYQSRTDKSPLAAQPVLIIKQSPSER